MRRYICFVLIVAFAVCGCKREAAEPQTPTAKTTEAPAEAVETAKVETPPPAAAEGKHPIVAVMREFLQATGAADYERAIALGTPGKFTRQGLVGMNQAFQMDQANVAQAWLGTEQAVVVTNPIPTKEGSQTAAWGFVLITTENGQWRIRDADFLPNADAIERYLAGFREVEPNAKAIEP